MTKETVLNGLNWGWIALMVLAPPLVSLLAAWPFWRKGGMIFGSIVGTAIIFGTSFSLIMREYVELDRATQACLDGGETSAFPSRAPSNGSRSMRFWALSKCSRCSPSAWWSSGGCATATIPRNGAECRRDLPEMRGSPPRGSARMPPCGVIFSKFKPRPAAVPEAIADDGPLVRVRRRRTRSRALPAPAAVCCASG